MSDAAFTTGTVDWTGENPGLYLKDDPAGPWLSLASLFRVTWSPYGMGHALVLLEDPDGERPGAVNACLTDNEVMARWLVANFIAHFGAFRGRAALESMPYMPLDRVTRGGDTRSEYLERVEAAGMVVELRWGQLGAPYAVDFPPGLSATGKHQMYSLFLDSDDASITVDGRVLPGRVVPRPVAGRESRSAFLAFSETWIVK